MKKEYIYNREPLISKLPYNSRLVKKFGKKSLYTVKSQPYFDGLKVTPEFYSLMKVLFSFWSTFTFKRDFFTTRNTEIGRRDFLNYKILIPLNQLIKRSFPSIISGKKTVRMCWVNEIDADGKIHVHVLFWVDPRVTEEVHELIWKHLQLLHLYIFKEVKSYDCDKISYQAGLISYFCKVQDMENCKHFSFSMGFKEIIQKFYNKKFIDDKPKSQKPLPYVPEKGSIEEILINLQAEKSFTSSVSSSTESSSPYSPNTSIGSLLSASSSTGI
jgi:hypothetical protein